MLLYFTGDGLCSLEQVVDVDLNFWRGCPTVIGAFFSGEGSFFDDGDFSFWSGRGAFFSQGDLFLFFTWGGESPLLGENNAFMAEPSDRPAINDRLGGRKKVGV